MVGRIILAKNPSSGLVVLILDFGLSPLVEFIEARDAFLARDEAVPTLATFGACRVLGFLLTPA